MIEDGSPHEQMSDQTLMERVRLGDQRAFAQLYRRYYVKLQDFFYGMGRRCQCRPNQGGVRRKAYDAQPNGAVRENSHELRSRSPSMAIIGP